MTPCRPTKEQALCANCARRDIPVVHRGRNGTVIEDLRMDVSAVLKQGQRCTLWEPSLEQQQQREAA